MLTRRPATEADVDFIYRLREAAFRERIEALVGPWIEEDHRKSLAEDMAATPYAIVLEDGFAVGAVAVGHHDDHDFLDVAMIDPAHRDRGIGTRLMHQLMDEARDRGVPLRLSVLDGVRARRLYERLGFRVTLVVPPRTKMQWP